MAANPTFTSPTFAGELYREVFGPAVVDPAGLIDNGMATPIDQTKYKGVIYELGDTIELQNPSPTFNAQSTTADVGEVVLTTFPIEFHKQISLDTIRTSWYSGQLKNGSLNDYEYGPLVAQFVEDVYVPKLKSALNFLSLQGKTGLDATIGSISATLSGYTALYPQLNASGSVRKNLLSGAIGNNLTIASVTKGTTTTLTLGAGSAATDRLNVGDIVSIRLAAGTGWAALNVDAEVLSIASDTSIVVDVDTDALTSANYTANSGRVRYINRTNIIDVMQSHINKIPIAVRRREVKFAIPAHLAYEWQFANAAANQNGNANYFRGMYDMNFIDKQIVVLDDAPANTIGSWEASRVFMGFDLSDDYANVEVLWQGATADKVYRLRGAAKNGIAISSKYANEMTLTTPE